MSELAAVAPAFVEMAHQIRLRVMPGTMMVGGPGELLAWQADPE
jgi:hypothetical protein